MRRKGVYVLMGGNLGPVEEHFREVERLVGEAGIEILQKSAVYSSEAWGFESDLPFLNQLLELCTDIPPTQLMQLLLKWEQDLGRTRADTIGYASRTIDLDILYDGDTILNTERLTLPHPRLHLRRFCLVPLAELAPEFMHPVLHLSNQELLDQCPDNTDVWIHSPIGI